MSASCRDAAQRLARRLLESKIGLPFFAGLCAVADGLTTALAIESGLGYEMNAWAPTSLPGIILHTFAKLIATQYVHEFLPRRYAEMALQIACAVWGAAAVSNSFAIIHAPDISSILGGIGFALLFMHSVLRR